jgi:tryptophan-rich sensory protein
MGNLGKTLLDCDAAVPQHHFQGYDEKHYEIATTMKPSHILALNVCIAVPMATGIVAGFATTSHLRTWYALLNKPAFNPPGWIFGPMWSILYILMGISLFLIWRSAPGALRNRALLIFGIQLLLNFAWSFVFFYFGQPGLAFAEIILLWICILAMILQFRRISQTAALLQIPYLAWVGFAAYLNGSIWLIN